MNSGTFSKAEIKAKEAETLNAFQGINLLNIKSGVSQILNLIGKNGIFGEYTKHDISHINKVLNSLDDLIPKKTAEILTTGDWLMIVLSVYFHDLGMLVTEDEFNNRANSDFPSYKSNILSNISNVEFIKKVTNLGEDRSERFLYQEFVRNKHAERIKNWINGKVNESLGSCGPILNEIYDLLKPLPDKFKKDLGMVCESHHLSDLDDLQKYKVSYRYGSNPNESVNLHYCAIILRTADLLHITSDRTPSIEFRLINPSDPISQEEWYKQMAVSAIAPQPKYNKDGKVDLDAISDTIEVTAYFKEANKANGFFGLISYLNYARNELEKNFKWVQDAQAKYLNEYRFPWKYIDDTNIETEGFERKLFEFKLDQSRILQLLVGHTLYNDSTVVLREIIQNSIDALRLQQYISKNTNNQDQIGEVKIHWDSEKRFLTFSDNGTGMSQQIIEDHLLKVGSSRYQSESFKKVYPNFNPISRFGIGVLTCFLIADNVDIITNHDDDEKGKKLSIRKVDGKYLLQHIEKNELENFIKEHGTIIQLEVRHGIKMDNLENNIKRWILFPPCSVTLTIDSNEPISIGHKSPKAAVENFLTEIGYEVDNKTIKVEQHSHNGIELAFALKYSTYFNEWSFMSIPKYERPKIITPIGTCIEGVRVEFNSPGYNKSSLISVANAIGSHAPKTNVARSNIETTNGRANLLNDIYDLYINHIVEEIKNIQNNGQFSLTWAINESPYLLGPLIKNSHTSEESVDPSDESLLYNSLNKAEIFLIEQNLHRKAVSIDFLNNIKNIWIIDSNLFRSAESLIKEIPTSSSLTNVVKTLYESDADKNLGHVETLFCGFNSHDPLHKYVFKDRAINHIKVYPIERRVDLSWGLIPKDNNWFHINLNKLERSYQNKQIGGIDFYIQLSDCKIEGINDEMVIKTFNSIIILKGSPIHEFLVTMLSKLNMELNDEDKEVARRLMHIINGALSMRLPGQVNFGKWVKYLLNDSSSSVRESISDEILWKHIDKDLLEKAISETHWKIFDSSAWSRK